MKKSKEIFYFLTGLNNSIALFIIGISFLAGPPLHEHSKAFIYLIDPEVRKIIFISIVSAISSCISVYLLYYNRDFFKMNSNTLIKFFAFQFLFLMTIFFTIQLYIYLKYQ